jgi:hypothetical protein
MMECCVKRNETDKPVTRWRNLKNYAKWKKPDKNTILCDLYEMFQKDKSRK